MRAEHVGMDEKGIGRSARSRSSRLLIVAASVSLVASAVAAASIIPLFRPTPGTDAVPISPTSASGLVVAVARTAGGPGEWSNWARVFKYLSEELDRPVTVRYLSKEEEVSGIMSAEQVDLALVCPHSYLDLSEQGRVVAVAAPVIDGSATTRSMLVVPSGSDVRSLADLEGKRIAVSDKTSLGGYAYLMWLCERDGVNPGEFFGEMRLGDTQEVNLREMLAGEVDCTVVNRSQGALLDSRVRVVERSPVFGTPPVVAASTLDTATVNAVRSALLAFDPKVQLAGAHSSIGGFVEVKAGTYDFVHELRVACGHHGHVGPTR